MRNQCIFKSKDEEQEEEEKKRKRRRKRKKRKKRKEKEKRLDRNLTTPTCGWGKKTIKLLKHSEQQNE